MRVAEICRLESGYVITDNENSNSHLAISAHSLENFNLVESQLIYFTFHLF